MLGWAPAYLDADMQMQMFRKATHPPTGLGTASTPSPRSRVCWRRPTPRSTRMSASSSYCDASKIIWEQAPWIFLWTQSFPVVHATDVTGITTTPTEKFDAIHARPAS